MNLEKIKRVKMEIRNAKANAIDFIKWQKNEISLNELVENFVNRCEPEYQEDGKKWFTGELECNKLPNISSGSTFTALVDFDNILSAAHANDDELNDEEYEIAFSFYNVLMRSVKFIGYTM